MEFICPIIAGIVGILLGIKIGIERLANDLMDQSRISPNEHTYMTSIEYFKNCFKLK
jgi:hypothetical protein